MKTGDIVRHSKEYLKKNNIPHWSLMEYTDLGTVVNVVEKEGDTWVKVRWTDDGLEENYLIERLEVARAV